MAVHALAVARVQARPPPGERFKEPGDVMGWSCREDFANNVSTVFELQVKALAYRLGIGGDHFEAEGVRLTKWDHDSTEVGDRPALGVPA